MMRFSCTEETHHLHHLITYVDDDYHYKIDVPQKYLKNVDKVKTQIEGGSGVVFEGLAQLVAENAEKFKAYVEDLCALDFHWNQACHCGFAS